MKTVKTLAAMLALALGALPAARAQIAVEAPWVRATVPQQQTTGAFMQLRAAQDRRLVAASSPLTPTVELHEMSLQGDVMRMREIPFLELPAGRTVELRPGSHHLMLLNLKAQVKEGQSVPLTLVFEGRDGQRESVQVQAPVRALSHGAQGAGQGHDHGSGHGGSQGQHKH